MPNTIEPKFNNIEGKTFAIFSYYSYRNMEYAPSEIRIDQQFLYKIIESIETAKNMLINSILLQPFFESWLNSQNTICVYIDCEKRNIEAARGPLQEIAKTLKITNGMDAIQPTQDSIKTERVSDNYDISSFIFNVNAVKGKKVIVFGKVYLDGKSFKDTQSKLLQAGAEDVATVVIARASKPLNKFVDGSQYIFYQNMAGKYIHHPDMVF